MGMYNLMVKDTKLEIVSRFDNYFNEQFLITSKKLMEILGEQKKNT